ncbi:hypothetical protein [Helicobacter cetorum]|uniref:Sialidase A n=1 Tax=Helicobacter cetorum (strain ATCC BAA-540 / CCUG 52418 / MIT 99-5656) TaxID=1163745 RepID=I0ET16_HELCM|nr:hypothetical protein [Helicobacter cetorum]AFI06085.1 hypothetical protein HCD_05415 [Helicobacter cetorum MIT 99-5656]
MEQNKKNLEDLDISKDIQKISKNISGATLEELSLKTLDKNLQILRDIGVQEICKATKIASKNINYLLEKRYEALSRVHARGFIQILEREYKIDLSAWMIEFDKVCIFKEGVGENLTKNQEASLEEKATHKHKIELDYSINQANISLSKKSSKWKVFVLIGIILVLILIIFVAQNSLSNDPSLKEESHKELEKSPIANPKSSSDSNLSEEATLEPQQDKSTKLDKEEELEAIYIMPKQDVWVEVIDLDEKKNSFQKILKENYSLATNKHRLLLHFGHGNLALKSRGELQTFSDNKTKRFLYEPAKGLELINESQYKKLQQ